MGVGFGWMPLYLIHDGLKGGTLRELKYVGGSSYRFTHILSIEPTGDSGAQGYSL